MKERKLWIDYSKFISIFLVVSYHTPPAFDGVEAYLLKLLRMPAFFLIAGYLFRADKFADLKSFIQHRSKQLLVPYCCFSMLFYVLWLVQAQWLEHNSIGVAWYKPIIEFFWGHPTLVVATFWFITCLFSIQVIYYLWSKYVPRWLYGLIFLAPLLNEFGGTENLPWCLSQAFQYIPFYAFSNHFKGFLSRLNKDSWPRVSGITLIALICIGADYWLDCPTFLGRMLYTVGGICILPAYIYLCKLLAKVVPSNYFTDTIARNTIVVLAVQNYIIGVFKLVLCHFFGATFFDGQYALNVLLTLAVLALSLIPIECINRYCPGFIGRGKDNAQTTNG